MRLERYGGVDSNVDKVLNAAISDEAELHGFSAPVQTERLETGSGLRCAASPMCQTSSLEQADGMLQDSTLN